MQKIRHTKLKFMNLALKREMGINQERQFILYAYKLYRYVHIPYVYMYVCKQWDS